MKTIAVLGGGAGGASALVELTARGYEVRLWNRRAETIAGIGERGVGFDGVLGSGRVRPALVTTDLAAALDGAHAAVVCLPAIAHGRLAADLAALGAALPIVLNPGHTGGALHFRAVFAERGVPLPPLAELSTLTYVARKPAADAVNITGRAGRVRAACLPGHSAALAVGVELFPAAAPVGDVLATGLANVNLVLHPPGAVLAAAWVEATGGDFTFYVEGMTPGVARVLACLDAERRSVARGFGHELPDLLTEMAAIGTVDPAAAARGDVGDAIRGGEANARIKAPPSLRHRYYTEDFGYGLLPLVELSRIAGVPLRVAPALLELGAALVGPEVVTGGLDAGRLGIAGLDRDGLLAMIRS